MTIRNLFSYLKRIYILDHKQTKEIIVELNILRLLKALYVYIRILSVSSKKLSQNLTKEQRKIGGKGSKNKYFDLKLWIFRNMLRALRLDLDRLEKITIIDLGSGLCFFSIIAEHYGHEVWNIDLPEDSDSKYYGDIYSTVPKILNRKKVFHNITPEKPLPKCIEELIVKSEREILIVGYMICFNNHKTKNLWGKKEWEKFINNLNEIKNDTSIYLQFNAEENGEFFSEQVKSIFIKNHFIQIGENCQSKKGIKLRDKQIIINSKEIVR